MKKKLLTFISTLSLAASSSADNIEYTLSHGVIGGYESSAWAHHYGELTFNDLRKLGNEFEKSTIADRKESSGRGHSTAVTRGDTGQIGVAGRPGFRRARASSIASVNSRNTTVSMQNIAEVIAPIEADSNTSASGRAELTLKNLHFDHPFLKANPHHELIVHFVFSVDGTVSYAKRELDAHSLFSAHMFSMGYKIVNPFSEHIERANLETGGDDVKVTTAPHLVDEDLGTWFGHSAELLNPVGHLVSKAIPVNQHSVMDVTLSLEGSVSAYGSNLITMNLGNTARLKDVIWLDKNNQPVEPGTLKIGEKGPTIFEKGKRVIHYSNEPTAIFSGVLHGDWAHSQVKPSNGAAKMTVDVPAGAQVISAHLYTVVSGSGTGLPSKPTLVVDGQAFQGDQLKVAARLPEESANPKAAYRVSILSPAATKEYDGSPIEFNIAGAAAESTEIEEYQLILVYQDSNAEVRSLALFDGHISGNYTLRADSGIASSSDAFQASMLLGGRGDIMADDATIEGASGESSAPVAEGQRTAEISVSPNESDFPFLFGINVTTESQLTLGLSEGNTKPTNQEPEFTGEFWIADTRVSDSGEVEFDVHSDPQEDLIIDSSNDLRNWEPVVNFVSPEGLTTFVDQSPKEHAPRYFRVRKPNEEEEDPNL